MPSAASSPRGRKSSVAEVAAAPAAASPKSRQRTSSAKPSSAPAKSTASPSPSSAATAEKSIASPVLNSKTYPVNGEPFVTSGSSASGMAVVGKRISGLPAPVHFRSNGSGAAAQRPLIAPPSTTAASASTAAGPNTTNVVGNERGRIAKTQPYLVEEDFMDGAYDPHTIVFFVGLCATVAAAAYLMMGSTDAVYNAKVGFGALSAAFIVFCAVYLPDELFIRPHPAVWRALNGVNILYVSLITFLIFQDVPTIRGYLAVLDPKLASDLPERSYADDCRLSTPEDPYKWFHTIFDEFLIAHFLGYFCKMIIIRDWRLVMALSMLFEVVELSLQHILPNFKECWWDHVIIDILICNAGGMVAGILFLRAFGLGQYQWAKLSDIPSVGGKLKRLVSQLSPRSIDPYEWQVFKSPTRFGIVCFLLCYNLTMEFNSFAIKSILHMPSNHKLTIARLVIWGFIAVPGARGLFVYCVEEGPLRRKRLPMATWACLSTLIFECIWINKMRIEGNYFQEPMPGYVGVPLYTSFYLFIIWFVMHFMLVSVRERSFAFRVATNVVFYLIPLCLLALFFMTNVDMKWKQKEFMAFVEYYRPYGFGALEEGHLTFGGSTKYAPSPKL